MIQKFRHVANQDIYHLWHKKLTMPVQFRFNQLRFKTEWLQHNLERSACALLAKALLIGLTAAGIFLLPAAAAQNSVPTALSDPGPSVSENTPTQAKSANFGREFSSPEVKKLADWVMDSNDNTKLPFIIVDKVNARVFVFDAQGQLTGASVALMGVAVGDDSVPGIGQRKLTSIRPAERTTPAGRFVASLDRDIHGQEVLWVDYDAAFSLHPMVKGTPKERRAERMASPSPLERRISYGCINVPPKFYEKVVSPIFKGTNGIVYVLPETRSAEQVFGSYDVHDSSRTQASTSPAAAINSAVR